ncbi:growth arrest and DNA damage-inducible proteins-interacting protein 1-like [Huso huso]|uniref:Large ribosomal subunit protein mL64 n=1 Tax=Huso huso TaxID=61971 RepID=A0ABR0Y945_HUSHU
MAASVLNRRASQMWCLLKGIWPLYAPLPVSTCCNLIQVANYNSRPLRLNMKDAYIPDWNSERTPEWQKTDKFERKLYGRLGSASGVDPTRLWPSPEQLSEMVAEERGWYPSLQEMQKNIAVKERELAKKRQAREKLIAANMAKMPMMVAEWRREARELKQKQREEKVRRERLLAEARERFGYALDPRSPKFQEMVKEIEKEEKKKRKLLKRRKKEEESRSETPAQAPAT